jgi:hypothetical protein
VAQVVDVVGGDERDAGAAVDAHERLVHARLQVDAVALQLEPEVLGPEEVAEARGELLGLALLVGERELRHLARQAAGQAGQPARVLRQQPGEELRPGAAPRVGRRGEQHQILPASFRASSVRWW